MNHQFSSPKKLCVVYKNMQKLIKISESNMLRELINSAFENCPGGCPHSYKIQYFDSDIEEYIDLDDVFFLEETKKIRIIDEDIDELDTSNVKHENDTDSVENKDIEKDDEEEDGDYENDSDEYDNDGCDGNPKEDYGNVPGTDESKNFDSDKDMKKDITCSSKSLKEETKFLPWPRPFLFKDNMIGEKLLSALNNKQKLSRSQFTDIKAAIFDECTKYTYHPKDWQYNELMMSLITRWPHLQNGYKTERDAQFAIRRKIIEFFKNRRKRKCNDIPECIVAKQKFKFDREKKKSSSEDLEACRSLVNVWGVNNFLPAEDQNLNSVEKSIAEMKHQYSKLPHNRQKKVLSEAMEATYAVRRNDILIAAKKIDYLIEQYPCLQDPIQVFEEFRRLKDIDFFSKWSLYFESKAKVILKLEPPNSSRVDFLMDKLAKLDIGVTDSGELVKLAIILLPSLLREDACRIFKNFGRSQFPQLQAIGESEITTLLSAMNAKSYHVLVDGVKLCETDDFVSAIQLLFASFYIFNICYPKFLMSFYTFLQTEVFGIDENAVQINKLINLVKNINDHS